MKALAGAWIVLLGGCTLSQPPRPLQRFEKMERHMATPCWVKLYAAGEEEAERGFAAAFAEIAAVDAAMNDYRPDSEISLLSAASGGPALRVSERFHDVLSASLRNAEVSSGAFDVTVGPIVRLWREARKARSLPAPDLLKEALSRVGYRHLRLEKGLARLDRKGMVLDVGGIAKGYACDRALAALAKLGLRSAMVDAGGGMALGDPPPEHPKGWRIQLADEEGKVMQLSRCGVATSGDWERFVEIGGVRYSHIVDPATGLGLTRRELVTVVAPNAMDADALSTAVSVLGPEKGLKLAEDLPGVEAWIRWEDAGQVRRTQTSGFPVR